jgi:hypothetical protein
MIERVKTLALFKGEGRVRVDVFFSSRFLTFSNENLMQGLPNQALRLADFY